jgi:N-acetylglutamate synthase-like GNAT family acetyltransferase
MDFLLTIFGNDEIPQPFDEEMFKLVATLSAAANKKGMGVGGMLVSAANDYAVSKGLRVKPVCSFASAWYERHPQFMDIIDRV